MDKVKEPNRDTTLQLGFFGLGSLESFMRVYIKGFAAAVVTLCIVANGFGQQRMSESQVEAHLAKESEARKSIPHRISKSVTFNLGKPTTWIIENAGPSRSRTVSERHVKDRLQRTETVLIDGVKYVRVDNDPWSMEEQSREYPANAEGNTPGSFVNSSTTTPGAVVTRGFGSDPGRIEEKFKHLGQEVVGGITTEVYQKVRKHIVANGYVTFTTKFKYWFDAQGRLLKETEDMHSPTGKRVSSSTTDYAYGLTLNIEAPIK